MNFGKRWCLPTVVTLLMTADIHDLPSEMCVIMMLKMSEQMYELF